MTQEQLGEELGGWTKTAVSAAERSWDGKKVRQFDADLLADLASIFHVPVPALFLPPPDDGDRARYVIDGPDPVPMEEFFTYLWPEPYWEEGTGAYAAYQQAVISATARYGDTEIAEAVAGAVAGMAKEEEIEGVLRQARATREELAGLHSLVDRLAEENAMLQQALERALNEMRAER